jgi:Predicted Zn-dependent protease (DUF2268)
MIEALNLHGAPELQQGLEGNITEYYEEARRLMPELSEDIKIFFSDDVLNPDTGVGGYAYDHDIITIAFDANFKDKAVQQKDLRGVVFHEAYHLAHGFHGQIPGLTALRVAVYEGAATVFERDTCGVSVGQYGDDDEMRKWIKQIEPLGKDFDWYKWKVFDEESGKAAILYAVGAYIIDIALQKSRLGILDLRHKTADEILKLAEL